MWTLENGSTVHLYTIALPIDNDGEDVVNDCISEAEKERGKRYRSETAARTYIQSHYILRIILSKYLNCKPCDIEFYFSARGKPFLAGIRNLFFSISYRQDYLLVAVSDNSVTGCDLEKILKPENTDDFLNIYFADDEIMYINSYSTEKDRLNAMYQLWTMKEAFAKAAGNGIEEKLKNMSFLSFLSEPVNKLLFDHDRIWHIESWKVNAEHVASFAVESENLKIKHFNHLDGLSNLVRKS